MRWPPPTRSSPGPASASWCSPTHVATGSFRLWKQSPECSTPRPTASWRWPNHSGWGYRRVACRAAGPPTRAQSPPPTPHRPRATTHGLAAHQIAHRSRCPRHRVCLTVPDSPPGQRLPGADKAAIDRPISVTVALGAQMIRGDGSIRRGGRPAQRRVGRHPTTILGCDSERIGHRSRSTGPPAPRAPRGLRPGAPPVSQPVAGVLLLLTVATRVRARRSANPPPGYPATSNPKERARSHTNTDRHE